MHLEEIAGLDSQAADVARQAPLGLAVQDAQTANLEPVPLCAVCLLCAVGRDNPSLLAELQVRIAARIGIHHPLIFG